MSSYVRDGEFSENSRPFLNKKCNLSRVISAAGGVSIGRAMAHFAFWPYFKNWLIKHLRSTSLEEMPA
jgi:hypothetical protein